MVTLVVVTVVVVVAVDVVIVVGVVVVAVVVELTRKVVVGTMTIEKRKVRKETHSVRAIFTCGGCIFALG